jgi:hypothetical protein
MLRRAMRFFISCALACPFWLFPFSLPADAQTDKTLTAQVGEPYSAEVQAKGGLAPLTWRVPQARCHRACASSPTAKYKGLPQRRRAPRLHSR